MDKTLFEKVWENHIVKKLEGDICVLYIDKHLIHEVTSPQAFLGLEQRNKKVFRPNKTIATADHNIPTLEQHLPIKEELSRKQVQKLIENTKKYGIELYGLGHEYNGIVHVIGPELGITQPGMTIVCGDSHTSTHGAFGTIAFGIGTSEVEMVLSSQTLLQQKPKTMRINVEGKLDKGVTAKDVILYLMSKIGVSGGTGYFIEYAGSTIRNLSMEGRMTICNMSIEMGARGGMIAPDETTFEYIKGRQFAPKGNDFETKVKYWKTLKTDENAKFDKELNFLASDIEPMITYGTNPGMGIKISDSIPSDKDLNENEKYNFIKSLNYMGFEPNKKIVGMPIDYVFLGSCTNSRIEDFREFANFVKGKKKSQNVIAWIVPGSNQVSEQVKKEKLDLILKEAGFEFRQPGCSACLAMNEDKIPAGKYAVSTSNRNFEGRQGPGARTMLVSPLTAAACAIEGKIIDPRKFLV